jgi:uncharacterized protein YkwD
MRNKICLLMLILMVAGMSPIWAQDQAQTQQAMSQVACAKLALAGCHVADAITQLESAQTLLPDWLVPREWLAVAYQEQGNKDQALAEYSFLQRKSYDFDPCGRANPLGTEDLVVSCEALTLWLVNDTRKQQGLSVLRPEPQLSVMARGHSLEMRDLQYFAHESPTAACCQPMDRFRGVFCFLPSYLAENIARRWGSTPCLSLDNMAVTHGDFLKSPGHRANILCTEVDCFGVGVATDDQGAYWVTEDFAHYDASGGDTWTN